MVNLGNLAENIGRGLGTAARYTMLTNPVSSYFIGVGSGFIGGLRGIPVAPHYANLGAYATDLQAQGAAMLHQAGIIYLLDTQTNAEITSLRTSRDQLKNNVTVNPDRDLFDDKNTPTGVIPSHMNYLTANFEPQLTATRDYLIHLGTYVKILYDEVPRPQRGLVDQQYDSGKRRGILAELNRVQAKWDAIKARKLAADVKRNYVTTNLAVLTPGQVNRLNAEVLDEKNEISRLVSQLYKDDKVRLETTLTSLVR